MENTRDVLPCGKLRVEGKEYLLLYPRPLESDWEQVYGLLRFVVVPNVLVGREKIDRTKLFYPHARHILVHPTNFSIEYSTWNPISVIVGEFDDGVVAWEEYDLEPEDINE